MKPPVPLLSPLLRSNTQGIILAELYLFPEHEQTPSTLARKAETSLPTVLRELERLLTAGYISERRSGRNRYFRVNQVHPLYQPMVQLLQHSYGPLAILPEVLARVSGIEEAYIYGSWAARYLNEPGADPRDIDVLAIGDTNRSEIFETAGLATRMMGREVNIRAITREDWEHSPDLFVRNVRAGALVAIPLSERKTRW